MIGTATYAELARRAAKSPPRVAIVLGSGLGNVVRAVQQDCRVAYSNVPGFPTTTVAGHSGLLTLGDWAGKRVLVFEGRFHFYEGHDWNQVVKPMRVAADLGVQTVLLTNAAGGIHPELEPGSLMAIRDHIEWTRPACWRLPGPGGLGGTRPSPYAGHLLRLAEHAGLLAGIPIRTGTYAMVTGPCYETPAEIRALQVWGADAVGMSTAREAQAAFERGLACLGISCIANRAAGLSATPLTHQEVLEGMRATSKRLAKVLEQVLRLLPN